VKKNEFSGLHVLTVFRGVFISKVGRTECYEANIQYVVI
jgi:hypothetical protein